MDKKNVGMAAGKSGLASSPLFANDLFYVGALALLVIIVFAPFLFSDKMLFGSDTMGGLDSRVFLKSSIEKYHQFPLWFNSRLGGMPSIDALFGDAMYLPTLLIDAVQPISRALGLRLVLHVFLAGLFFFLMLRKGFKMPAFVAGIGGALYMLNPEFFSHVYPGHDGKMFVIAWLPFVMWRLKSLVETPRFLNATLLSLGIAMCLFTSQIQMCYFMMWGVALYWFAAAVFMWTKEKKVLPLAKMSGFVALAVLLGFGLSLIQFLPPFMFVREAFSVRGVERGFEYAASWSLHWPEVFSLWVPDFGGFDIGDVQTYWSENPFKLNTEYPGAIALLFSIFAIVQKPRPWRIFWGGVALCAVLYSLGAHTPVFYAAYYLVPGVSKFRAASMLMFWFSFATVLLSCLFFKDTIAGYFSRMSDAEKKKWTKGLLIALGSVTALATLFSVQGFVVGVMNVFTTALSDTQKFSIFERNFAKDFVPFLWVWWFFAGSSMALLLGVVNNKVGKNAFLIAVAAIALIDVCRVDSRFVTTVNPKPYFYAEQTIADLQNEMKQEPFRCFVLPGALPKGGEGILGLEGVGGFHDNELRWYRNFRGDQEDRNYYTNLLGVQQDGRPYLRPENLKYGNSFLNIANARYYLVRQGETLYKIPNEGALKRISFTPGYVVLDSGQIADALRNGTYDYRKTVGLYAEPAQKPAAVDSSFVAQTSVQWKAYTPNYRKAEVSVNADGFLRISEVYYPGWEIRIDGKPAKIYRADLAWMAVNITKGSHTVEMLPHSLYLKKAEIVSYPLMILFGIYWIGIAAVRLRRKKT